MGKGATYERELKHLLEKRGWIVGRSAGSNGIDLIATKPGITLLFEVKATKEMKYRLSGRGYKQYHYLHDLWKKGYNILYALRHIGTKQWLCMIPQYKSPGVIDLQELPHIEAMLLLYEAFSVVEDRGNSSNILIDENSGGVIL